MSGQGGFEVAEFDLEIVDHAAIVGPGPDAGRGRENLELAPDPANGVLELLAQGKFGL